VIWRPKATPLQFPSPPHAASAVRINRWSSERRTQRSRQAFYVAMW